MFCHKHCFSWTIDNGQDYKTTQIHEWMAIATNLKEQRELAAHTMKALSGCLDLGR